MLYTGNWQAHCSPIGWYFVSTNCQPIGVYSRVGLVWPCTRNFTIDSPIFLLLGPKKIISFHQRFPFFCFWAICPQHFGLMKSPACIQKIRFYFVSCEEKYRVSTLSYQLQTIRVLISSKISVLVPILWIEYFTKCCRWVLCPPPPKKWC